MAEPLVYKATRPRRRRTRTITTTLASAAVGRLEPGCEIFGLTMGQFSLIELVAACLAETGPADVTICTWTAANADTRHAYMLLENGAISSLRFVVDFSFRSRQPAFCATLIERFGAASLRITNVHAKFVLIRNDNWNLAIRTSMNLNQNKRLEDFEISDDPDLADMLAGFVDDLYAAQSESEMLNGRPGQLRRTLHLDDDAPPDALFAGLEPLPWDLGSARHAT